MNLKNCPNGHIAYPIAVQITQRGCRAAELIVIIQDACEAAFGIADLLVRQNHARLCSGQLSFGQ